MAGGSPARDRDIRCPGKDPPGLCAFAGSSADKAGRTAIGALLKPGFGPPQSTAFRLSLGLRMPCITGFTKWKNLVVFSYI